MAVAGLSALARRLSVPYPIMLVVALLGFVPGLPEVRLDPEVALPVFLPPLLHGEARRTGVVLSVVTYSHFVEHRARHGSS